MLPTVYSPAADIANPDFFRVVVRPGLGSTSPAFMRSSASQPAGRHDPLALKNGRSGPHCWGWELSTQFAQRFASDCDSFTACMRCRLEPPSLLLLSTQRPCLFGGVLPYFKVTGHPVPLSSIGFKCPDCFILELNESGRHSVSGPGCRLNGRRGIPLTGVPRNGRKKNENLTASF